MGARFLKVCACFICLVCVFGGVTYGTIPTHNIDASHFDTIIVLGAPPDPDGSPSSEERARVTEAVHEYQTGRAAHIIVTGGSPHSRQPEGEVMARVAEAEGVPATAVVVESQARNTVENIYFSHQLMEQNGWTTAEVVSSPSHLPRAALILEHYHLGWRTKAAVWPPEYSWRRIGRYYLREVPGTIALRLFGFRPSPFLPRSQTSSGTIVPRQQWSAFERSRCA